MHVVVVTCAHRGDDARIVHRQARSLVEAGHRVTLVAPTPPAASLAADPDSIERVAIPRATGRRRVGSWRAARRAVHELMPPAGTADLLLVHDPELVPQLARRRAAVPVVWDVHEDYVASIGDRRYIPGPLRRPVRWAVERVERRAIARCRLLLAEDAYAERLGDHPVVPNATWVPEHPPPPRESTVLSAPDDHYGTSTQSERRVRVVYAGRVSTSRGARELIEIGRRLHGRAMVEVFGDADADVRDEIAAAHEAGHLVWLGYLPNPVAIERLAGAFAGLSLLHDEPNYRHSRPTKLVEYLAQGVPVISTPLPVAAALVSASRGGVVTTFESAVDDTISAIEHWIANPEARQAAVDDGHRYVRTHHAWQDHGARFVTLLERWAVT